MYEGEVTELTPAETENPLSGYGKTISHVVVALKTAKGTKQLRLDPSIYESIQKERVTVGDVIYIEANTGAVKVRSSSPHNFPRRLDTFKPRLNREWNCRTASRPFGCVRDRVRPRGGRVRPLAQGRRAQEEGDCPGRDAA